MLSPDDAAALVDGSVLFDEEWYAALTGRSFGSRAEAVAQWVADPRDDSPHPLFEPAWLYPKGAWRRHAPDPLSFYLSRERPRRSPHPDYPVGDLGPVEDWLAAGHDPADLLAAPVERAFVGEVWVELAGFDLAWETRWLRHLLRLDVNVLLDPHEQDCRRRVLERLAAPHARVLVDERAPEGSVLVWVDDDIEPPPWPWLPPLLAAAEQPGTTAQAVVVDDDVLVQGPVLVGHPVSAVERLAEVDLPAQFRGIRAMRTGSPSRVVLATDSWVPGPRDERTGPGWDELERRARATTGLRWSIDIAAGAAPIGRRWGDWHFARSLADALERLGQWVEIDHPETRGRTTRAESDVVLVIRGLERVAPQPGAVNLLWVISHPEDVTPDELASFDVAWAAGTAWAERHGVRPLLQCTDATRFHPGVGEADPDGRALFVGNARGEPRPVVTGALETGVALDVIGHGWAEHGVAATADRIANTDLPAAYAAAGVVLNDHHVDMRAEGFVSNRVFDVLAVGGRLLTDDVPGLAAAVGADVPTWRTPADLARLARPPYAAWPGADERRALAERVVAEHSFDARAATILAAARSLVDSRG